MEGGIFLLSRESYIRKSLELNLFYQRIMKEHLFFIEINIPSFETAYIIESNILKKSFEELLAESIILSKGVISEESLNSNEIVTPFTLSAEEITSSLTGASLNTNLTKAELDFNLEIDFNCTDWLEAKVFNLNKRSKYLLEDVINFKKKIYKLQSECRLSIGLYPQMIIHITEEAELYMEILNCLMYGDLPPRTICEELNFWNHLMEEHAEFINGMLDPTEKELKKAADKFDIRFEILIKECIKSSDREIIRKSLNATTDIKDFKKAATEGLLKCEIKSIISPLLADHVLREAYHYIRILKNKI